MIVFRGSTWPASAEAVADWMLVIPWYCVASLSPSLEIVISWLPSKVVTAAAAAVESFVWEICGFAGGGGSSADVGEVGAEGESAGHTQVQFHVQLQSQACW